MPIRTHRCSVTYDDEEDQVVRFSDGTTLIVPPGETVYWSRVGEYQWWLPFVRG